MTPEPFDRAPRTPARLRVRITCGDQSFAALGRDLSKTGLMLVVDSDAAATIAPGARVGVSIALPRAGGRLELQAILVWKRAASRDPLGHRSTFAGVTFSDLDAAASEGIGSLLDDFRVTVLAVAADPAIRRAVEGLLGDRHRVLVASTASTALDAIEANDVALLIVADRLDDVDGLGFLWAFEANCPEHPAIKLVILSANHDAAAILQYSNTGHIFHYLDASSLADDLRGTVARAIEHYWLTAGPRLELEARDEAAALGAAGAAAAGTLPADLARLPMFADMPPEASRAFASCLKTVELARDAIVCREGEWGDRMWIVGTGRVKVFTAEGQNERILAYLGPGAILGEMALLLGKRRTASARMIVAGDLYELRRDDLERLLEDHPSISRALTRELAKRLADTTRQPSLRKETRVIAVEGPVLATWLAEAFRLLGDRVATIRVGEPAGAPTATATEESELRRLIGGAIGSHDRVLLAAPLGWDSRGRLAAQLADAAVIHASRAPAAPLGPRVFAAVSREVAGRVAREISDRRVALVLSSGGAHGLAHVGVIRVLLNEHVPIDVVAGSSAGAFFGAMFCAGWAPDRIAEIALALDRRIRVTAGLWDFGLKPWSGLLRGTKARGWLEELFAGKSFADLDTPLLVVATDIVAGEEVVFDSGSVAEAVRASTCIPGVFMPWQNAGRYLLDGAVSNPLPISVARARGARYIIASSVVRPPGGKRRIRGAAAPNFVEQAFAMVSSTEEILTRALRETDVLIRPAVGAYGVTEYDRAMAIIDAGERAAREALAKIREVVSAAGGLTGG